GHHDQVVAVDHLVAALVAEEPRQVAGVRALDAIDLRRSIVHQPARYLAAVRAEAAHAVAHAEGTLHGAHPRGQEAAAALRQRALRAGVEVERAGGPARVGDPVLAPAERIAVGAQQRAELRP